MSSALSSTIATRPFAFSRQEKQTLVLELILVLIAGFIGSMDFGPFTLLAITLVAATTFWRFWRTLGIDIGIAELAASIAVLQWLIAPLLAYQVADYQRSSYAMVCSPNRYFAFAAPGTCAFVAGLLLARLMMPTKKPAEYFLSDKHDNLIYLFAGIGFLASVATPWVPLSLMFVAKLLTDLQLCAMVMLLYSKMRYRFLLMGLIASSIFINARNTAMFHDAILATAFFTMFSFLRYRTRSNQATQASLKFAVIVAGGICIFAIQIVKHEFRNLLNSGEDVSLVSLAVKRSLDSETLTDEKTVINMIARFNQGWIVSHILQHVPAYEPYFEGKTYLTSVEAILMPRILFPNKPIISVSRRFRDFTGLQLNERTYMGVSALGEAYGNFGETFGKVSVLLTGLVLGIAIEFYKRLSYSWPLLFFLMGSVFTEPIKAETDSLMAMNYLFKAILQSLVIAYLAKSWLPRSGRLLNQS